MLSILVDQREPDWIKQLKIFNIQSVITLLDSGDFWIATEQNELLIIERKTPEDLLGSIKDGRLFEQIHRMKQQTQWCYLLITGQFTIGQNGKVWVGQRETGWDFEDVEGALLTIQELGCFVIHCKNDLDFGVSVERLIKRKRGLVSIGAARSSKILDVGQQIVTALPGIGLITMQKLLEHHYTPARVIEHLSQVNLPTKKALGLQADESLIVVSSLDREFLGLDKEKVQNE